MTSDLTAGFPGFTVRGPGPLRPVPAALMFLAYGKLAAVEMLSATFDGERYGYDPWVTVIVFSDDQAVATGIYRSGTSDPGTDAPTHCVRRSTWDSLRDRRQAYDTYVAGGPEGFKQYLCNGRQVVDELVFGAGELLAGTVHATETLVTSLADGVSVRSRQWGPHQWGQVKFASGDDRLLVDVEYSPLTSRCDELERHLPPWLAALDQAVELTGTRPDHPVELTVTRSIAEVLQAPVRGVPRFLTAEEMAELG